MSDVNVRVICRFRPINDRERQEGDKHAPDVTLAFPDDNRCEVTQGGRDPAIFTFDRIFWDTSTTQEQVYELAARDSIEDILEGFNSTLFAYGQTGSGKSFTMFGPDIKNRNLWGIIPRACAHIFNYIEEDQEGIEFTIKCSFLEIYLEKVNDLLNPRQTGSLKVRETPDRGVWVDGLSEHYVSCADDVYDLLSLGEKSRATSSTKMNAVSSRSHSLFILTLIQKDKDGCTKTGKLNLADLAGSEKVGKTEAKGMRLDEAKKINQSLSALGLCINKLTTGGSHIPYRDSRLTHILRESLGGNSKTTLLICCSPHKFNVEETIGTLKFGQRAKKIKNAVKINRQRSVAELEAIVAQLTKELEQLQAYVQLLEAALKESNPEFDFAALRKQAGALAKKNAAAARAAAASGTRKRALGAIPPASPASAAAAAAAAPTSSTPASPSVSAAANKDASIDQESDEPDISGGAFGELEEMLQASALGGNTGGGADSVEMRMKLSKLRETMQMAMQDLKEELDDVKEEFEVAQEAKDAAQEEAKLLKVNVQKAEEALEAKTAESSAEIKRLGYELKQAVLASEESAAQLTNLKEHNDELVTTLSKAREETASSEAAREKAEAALEQLRRTNETTATAAARAEERQASLLQRAEAAEQAAAAASAARDEQESRADTLRKEALTKAEEAGSARQKADALAGQLERSQAQMAEAERKLKVETERAGELANRLKQMTSSSADAAAAEQSQLTEMQSKLDDARAQLESAEKQRSDAELKIGEAERAATEQERRATELQARLDEMEAAVGAAASAATGASAERAALEARDKAERERLSDAVRDATAQSDHLQRELDALRQKHSTLTASQRAEAEKTSDLRRALADAKAKAAGQTKALIAKDERLREVEAERQEAVARAENVRCQLDESVIKYIEMEKRLNARLSLLQEADRIARKTGGGSIARPVQQRGIVSSFFGGNRPALPDRSSLTNADKEGYLTKQGTSFVKNWKKRWFVLKGDSLYYFDNRDSGTPNGSVPLSGCFIQTTDELTRKKFSFGLFHPERRTFFLVAASMKDMTEWVDILNEKIDLLEEMYESDDE